MEGRMLLGCAYCERTDVELGICCRGHGRLVCAECVETPLYLREHETVAAAS